LCLHYRVEVSPRVYDLYESGCRDITAINSFVASKLVIQTDEMATTNTATNTLVEPSLRNIPTKIARGLTLLDVTGLASSKITWRPCYRNLNQEEFKIVCKNYSTVNFSFCFACAIHPGCTHVIKKYEYLIIIPICSVMCSDIFLFD
jgi:hypothetical protein